MIRPVELKDIPLQGSKGNKLKEEIENFIQLREPYGEVELETRMPQSVTASIKTYINRYNYPLKVTQKKGHVFVIRTDL